MNIIFHPHEHVLDPPISIFGDRLGLRESYILEFIDSDGHSAFSEAAPLPGFSNEHLGDVLIELKRIKQQISLKALPSVKEILMEGLSTLWGLEMSASVAFALESGVLSLLAAKEQRPMSQLISQHSADYVRLNTLISEPNSDINDHLNDMRIRGIKTIKVKVGRQDLIDDVEWVQYIASELEGDEKMRIDANRSWTLESVSAAMNEWQGLPIEYLEEPVADIEELRRIYDYTGASIALDESSRELLPSDWLYIPGVTAIVMKPTLYGGVSAIYKAAQFCEANGLDMVMSHSYESETGQNCLLELAKVFSKNVACGLQFSY